jgi:hypothetical protein
VTPHDPPPVADQRDAVVLAWEWSGNEDDSTRLAAFNMLAALARQIDAALLLPIDAGSERLSRQIVDTLVRNGVAALPVVAIDGPSSDGRSPVAAASPEAMLAMLASACKLVEWDNGRCLGIVADPGFAFDDALAALGAALGAPGRPVRVGWLRRHSAYMELPAGAHFAIDWPPYGAPAAIGTAAAPTDATAVEVDYALVASGIARRHSGESPVAPSVLWSSARSIVLPDVATRLTGVSPLKIAHAIDSARRFVRNRAGHGVPFWVLRVAFDPGAPADVAALPALRAALMRAHVASGSIASPGRIYLPVGSAARIAVVVHLYYPDLWNELAAAIATLPEPCDVFVSCSLRARDAVARIVRARFPGAVVFGIRNLGRDVLPFLHWLATSGVGRYEYVLKLHSKKSVHVVDPTLSPFGGGEGWRHQALGGLIGENSRAGALVRALDARPDVGIVAPAGLLYDQISWRCAAGDVVETLCARLALTGKVGGRFPAGTMFWARTAALAPLAGTSEDLLDFEREAGQVDGTLHHAYERLFPLVAAARGYRTIDSAQLLA